MALLRSQVQGGQAVIVCRPDRRPRRKEDLDSGSMALLRSRVQGAETVIDCCPDRRPLRKQGLESVSMAEDNRYLFVTLENTRPTSIFPGKRRL